MLEEKSFTFYFKFINLKFFKYEQKSADLSKVDDKRDEMLTALWVTMDDIIENRWWWNNRQEKFHLGRSLAAKSFDFEQLQHVDAKNSCRL